MNIRTALLTLPTLALAACVSSGPESQLGKQEQEAKDIRMSRTADCVFRSTVNDFRVLDDRHVVLFGMGRKRAYLAELTGGCFDVRYQSSLAVVDGDNNGQVCGFGRDSIAYERAGLVENCRITGLEQLTDERRLELGLGSTLPKPRKEKEKPAEDGKAGESK
jgi:hypothetical protein